MVDKLYIMLPEFKVQRYDMLRARQDYAKINAIFKESMKAFNNSQLAQDLFEEDPQDFKEWFSENKETYRLEKPKISKIKYDHSKLPQDNSRDARNNLMIDLIYGVLTNPDTASKMLNPGGFDPQKKADRILNILHSIRREELMKILRISDSRKILSTLQNLSIEQLTKLAKKTKEQLDPLSPYTQITLHNLNMTGAKLIGIYANHNANHALMQHTELALNDNGSFILNGKKLTSLHDIKNIDGNYISRNNAGFLAASVDNAKDPTLAGLNQNTFTADASMLLSRLGYNALEIGLLMTQPIVLDITQKFFRESREGKTKEAIIEEVIAKYKKSAGRMSENSYESYKNQDFKAEDLADYILTSQYIGNIKDASQTSNYSDIEYYKKQVAVGYLFSRILTSADALGELTQATRSDTQGGAAGPTIADTWNKVMKVQDLFESMESKNFPLKGINFIDATRFDGNVNNLRRDLLNNPLPFLQAFFSLGILETEGMLFRYFPHYNEAFSNVLDALRKETRLGKLDSKSINNIINDLFAYIMSKTEFFGADSKMTAYEKREMFINDFPKYFKEVTANNSDIASLEFIKRLKYIKANDNNPVGTIQFKNVGRLNYTLKERYTRDWVSLLYMKNPEAKKLALNLFLYSYYRNGFAFGPSAFIHLAPIALRIAIPDYMETLEGVLNSEDDFGLFVDQYIENHLDNRRFTPEIKEGTTVSFVNDKKEPLNKVQFYIHKESSIEDKGCVKKVIINEDGSQSYVFFNHIAKKHGNSYIYYRLSEINGNLAIYEKITPLGVKNNFIEYEYGVDVRDMKTSVKLRERYISRKERNLDDGSDNITPEEIDSKVREFDNESFSKEALEQSYGIVFGESVETEKQLPSNDIMYIEPNEEYSDANGLRLCKSGNFGNSNIIAEL